MSGYGALVLGASGFLGSHVVKQLAARGDDVRVMVRRTSNTESIKDLDLISYYGDVMDRASLVHAMQGCDTVYYCVVDTRAWLKDTGPLWETNIEGLRNAMDAALDAGVRRFVFTSTLATIGLADGRKATEEDAFNWGEIAPEYVVCRVEAENLLMEYCRDKGLPGMAMCVANTYGPDDYQPTPHGELIKNVALGKMPITIESSWPVVDIRDAADCLILAAEKGQTGERYIVASGYASQEDMYKYVASLGGVKPPGIKLSAKVAGFMAAVTEKVAALFGKKPKFNTDAVLLMHIFPDMDSTKAREQLGWKPRPFKDTLNDAVEFYLAERARRKSSPAE